MKNRALLTEEDFDIEEFREKMICDDTEAVVTYTKPVKKRREGAEVKHIEVEFYERATREGMVTIREQINDQFNIDHVVIIQRVGEVEAGKKVMGVLIGAPEKIEALQALDACLDLIESHVPLQIKVVTVDEREYWVRSDDHVMELYGQVAEGI